MPPPPKPQDTGDKFDLKYFSFHIADWERDTRDFPHLIRSCYLCAILDYIRFHCIGIINEDGRMQVACQCAASEWEIVKPIVFGHFFKIDGDRWHQKRARLEYEHVRRVYKNMVDQRTQAAVSRWKRSAKR